MRISDWSSDVCSSDLRLRGHRPVPAPASFGEAPEHLAARRDRPRDPRRDCGHFHPLGRPIMQLSTPMRILGGTIGLGAMLTAPALAAAPGTMDVTVTIPRQLGRASCRERVCQYV